MEGNNYTTLGNSVSESGINIDYESLNSIVVPEMEDAVKHLENARSILSSTAVPDDFCYFTTLTNNMPTTITGVHDGMKNISLWVKNVVAKFYAIEILNRISAEEGLTLCDFWDLLANEDETLVSDEEMKNLLSLEYKDAICDYATELVDRINADKNMLPSAFWDIVLEENRELLSDQEAVNVLSAYYILGCCQKVTDGLISRDAKYDYEGDKLISFDINAVSQSKYAVCATYVTMVLYEGGYLTEEFINQYYYHGTSYGRGSSDSMFLGSTMAMLQDTGWERVSIEDVQPGDICLYNNYSQGHIFIYAGDNAIWDQSTGCKEIQNGNNPTGKPIENGWSYWVDKTKYSNPEYLMIWRPVYPIENIFNDTSDVTDTSDIIDGTGLIDSTGLIDGSGLTDSDDIIAPIDVDGQI